MAKLFLMGVGSGDWLPLLALLVGIGVLVQLIDMTIKYFRERRRHKIEMMQRAFEEEMQIGQNPDPETSEG